MGQELLDLGDDWAEFERMRAEAERVRDSRLAAAEEVCTRKVKAAGEEYQRAHDAAWLDFDSAVAPLRARLAAPMAAI